MTTATPHFSKSADANKNAILSQLKKNLNKGNQILEIASGTGQHALHFSSQLADVSWQPSDVDLDAFHLSATLSANSRPNLLPAIELDIDNWSTKHSAYDAVFSANCIHVIPSPLVDKYVIGAASSLRTGGLMILYGPFKYGGQFTTPSNQSFDQFLRETYPDGGIRDFERIDRLAMENGLVFENDTPMPANNQFLVWRKISDT